MRSCALLACRLARRLTPTGSDRKSACRSACAQTDAVQGLCSVRGATCKEAHRRRSLRQNDGTAKGDRSPAQADRGQRCRWRLGRAGGGGSKRLRAWTWGGGTGTSGQDRQCGPPSVFTLSVPIIPTPPSIPKCTMLCRRFSLYRPRRSIPGTHRPYRAISD